MRFHVPRNKLPLYTGVATLMLSFVLRLYNFGMGNTVQEAAIQALAPAIGVYVGVRIGVWYFYRGKEDEQCGSS